MINVVFFVSGLGNGGLENYLLRFLRFKHTKFNRIIVYCKSGKDGFLEEKYSLIPNVEIVKNRIGYFSSKDLYNLYKFFKANDISAVCDFTGNFAALCLLVGRFAGIQNRIAFFRKDTNIFPETKVKLFYNYCLNRLLPLVSTHILSNSLSAFNFFFQSRWKNNNKFEVIYNGIDASQFLSTNEDLRKELLIPSNAFVVGHIGRYNKAKNHDAIIKVALELCKTNDCYFIICGNETDSKLKVNLRESELNDRIIFLGQRDDVIKVLNTLDCFYFPSLSEGQPNALIEALVAGIPFVASNIEPNKETVPLHLHSQLIDPCDVPTALLKIKEIRNSPTLGKALNVQEWAKDHYDPNILFEKFYQKIIYDDRKRKVQQK